MSIAVFRSDYETNCAASTSVRLDRKEARNRQLHIFAERYRQAPGLPERIIDSQNVFILIASRKDFARQNYKIQASLTRIS